MDMSSSEGAGAGASGGGKPDVRLAAKRARSMRGFRDERGKSFKVHGSLKHVGRAGVGVELFFRTLRWAGYVFMCSSLLGCISLANNLRSNENEANTVIKTTIGPCCKDSVEIELNQVRISCAQARCSCNLISHCALLCRALLCWTAGPPLARYLSCRHLVLVCAARKAALRCAARGQALYHHGRLFRRIARAAARRARAADRHVLRAIWQRGARSDWLLVSGLAEQARLGQSCSQLLSPVPPLHCPLSLSHVLRLPRALLVALTRTLACPQLFIDIAAPAARSLCAICRAGSSLTSSCMR